MLKEIGIEFSKKIIIYCDTTSIVGMSTNPVLHFKTKHISIKYRFFIKPLPKDTFEYLWGMLGVMPLPTSK